MIRTLLTGTATVLAVVLVGPVAIAASLLVGGPGPLYALTFPVLRVLMWIAGIRIDVRGRERIDPGQAYVFMPNHTSNVDAPVVFLAVGRRVRFLAKAELFRMPILGSMMRVASFVPVHRQDRGRAIAAVDEAATALKEGWDFLVFPEGTRSRADGLLPFKKGPFVMALSAGVPVVPMVVRGARALQPKGGFHIRPGRVEVEMLDPIPTIGMTYDQRDALRDRVQDVIQKRLAE